ncbi:hypothetical protein BH11PSE2_BH11PSE2_00720 [soil metagenome]
MSYAFERRALQISVAVAGLVPVGAGLQGLIFGLSAPGVFIDSHYRYLSGLLLGIGLAFWTAIPTIENRGALVRLLTLIVITGGLARLGAALSAGGGKAVLAALAMELVITPALCLWRERIEHMDRHTHSGYRGPWQ